MKVTIRLYGVLRDIAGRESITVEFDTEQTLLHEVIAKLLGASPGLSQFIKLNVDRAVEVRGVTVIINGRHAVFLGGEKALIKDGDVIDLIPPLHGGVSMERNYGADGYSV